MVRRIGLPWGVEVTDCVCFQKMRRKGSSQGFVAGLRVSFLEAGSQIAVISS